MNNLREVFQKYAAVVFFDTETTDLNAKTCQIIELAAIKIERAGDGTLYTAGRADMLIKLPDGQRIPEKITEVSGQQIEKVSYWPQRFNKYMQSPGDTLPALMKKRRK